MKRNRQFPKIQKSLLMLKRMIDFELTMDQVDYNAMRRNIMKTIRSIKR